ncbi:MAG: hypothetical protein GY845_09395 [Planctomycetes bacterium]|nr:hypothetical protein [Planctomycetota bacterium]
MQWPFKKKGFQKTLAKADHRPYKASMNKDQFAKWEHGTPGATLSFGAGTIPDAGAFYKRYYSFITRYYPAAGAAVWTWKNLCSTKQEVKFLGNSDSQKKKAVEETLELDKRISPFKFVKTDGMQFLISIFFKYIFTYGRFCGDMILDANNQGVATFKIGDPFKVRFDENRIPYVQRGDSQIYVKANEETFYYYGLNMDWENPYGSALMDSATELMYMAKQMLIDMQLASGNAGTPRLHIKIGQPQKLETEDDEDYTNRINSYFDSYVDQLVDLAPDDNFYSWDDVTVDTIGGWVGGSGFVWRNNRQVLDEEILSAFHLFPWVVGKSSQTTKNWVRSQFDLLLAQVESLQMEAGKFADWLRNTNLALVGINDIRTKHTFSMLRDPAMKDIAIAERFQIANVKEKVLMGIISIDDGARELGEDKAYDQDLIFKKGDDDKDSKTDTKDMGANSSGESSEEIILEEIGALETKIDEVLEGQEELKQEPSKQTGGADVSSNK